MKTILSSIFIFCVLLGSAQTLDILGCLDPAASNYDSNANVDNGLCCYERWIHVVTSGPCYLSFYSPEIGFIDGQVVDQSAYFCVPYTCLSANLQAYDTMTPFTYQVFESSGELLEGGVMFENDYDYFVLNNPDATTGCADPQACNYEPSVTCYDLTSCDYSCLGCTDASAPNYNPNATLSDGSCCSAENFIQFQVGDVDGQPVDWYIVNSAGWSYVARGDSSFCLPDGCYTFYRYGINESVASSISITNYAGFVLYEGSISAQFPVSFNLAAITGCPDGSACNYNPQANCLDWNLCDYSCFGCTNPSASNFNPVATIDDGSCCTSSYTIESNQSFEWMIWSTTNGFGISGVYPDQSTFCLPDGCYQWAVTNLLSNSPDGSVTWSITQDATGEQLNVQQDLLWMSYNLSNGGVSGCLNPSACNYNPLATCGNTVECTYDCLGCTDPSASNFDPDATINNGSCCYEQWCSVVLNQPGYWYVYSDNGISASGYQDANAGFCMPDGCYTLVGYPNEPSLDFSVQVFLGSNELSSGAYEPNMGSANLQWSINPIEGCLELGACNYNPEANCQATQSCDYSCYGCMDESALNFDPSATVPDGSCCFTNWFRLEFMNETQWTVYSNLTGTYQSGLFPQDDGFCMDSDCFELYCWSPTSLEDTCKIYDQNNALIFCDAVDMNYFGAAVTLGNSVSGCGDPYACNYNPNADCFHYFECQYGCYGCTNPTAVNYDADATQDDGTCCFNNGYSLISDGQLYWSAGNAIGFYSSGLTSDFSTFCSPEGCFFLYVMNYSGSTSTAQLLQADGLVIQEFTLAPYETEVVHVGVDNEVAGCTDANACNFNPDATCEDGSCYLCFGCTDPTALNYDVNAWLENGSCMYDMVPPMMGMMMLPDSAQNQFYVLANVMDLGNMPPYLLRNDYNAEETLVAETGQMMFGPFPCNEVVEFTVSSIEGNFMNAMQTTFATDCNTELQVENVATNTSLVVYPNPATDEIRIDHGKDAATVWIYDQTGRCGLSITQHASATPVSVLGLSSGIYQVVVEQQAGLSHTKLVVR